MTRLKIDMVKSKICYFFDTGGSDEICKNSKYTISYSSGKKHKPQVIKGLSFFDLEEIQSLLHGIFNEKGGWQ